MTSYDIMFQAMVLTHYGILYFSKQNRKVLGTTVPKIMAAMDMDVAASTEPLELYVVQVQQLSGACCQITLPDSAVVRDILLLLKKQKQDNQSVDHKAPGPMNRKLLFEGRVLGHQEALRSLAAPGLLEVQLICHQPRAERNVVWDNPQAVSARAFHFTLCGEHSVGKSSLMWRYAENIFRDPSVYPQSLVGHEFKTIHMMAGDTPVKLFLWDWPTGQERFRPGPAAFFRHKSAVMLVIDLTNPACLDDVDHWLSMMKKVNQSIPTKLLLGNKIDVQRQVHRDEAESFAAERGLYYFETSAKDGAGVMEAIDFAVFDALEKSPSVRPQATSVVQQSFPYPSCDMQ